MEKNLQGLGDEGAAFDLMIDEVGILGAKAMGVYGAMKRGLSKEDALKKYHMTEAEYQEGYRQAFEEGE